MLVSMTGAGGLLHPVSTDPTPPHTRGQIATVQRGSVYRSTLTSRVCHER